MLAPADVQRYARQILVPQVGRPGQERWLAARVEAAGEGSALDAAVELLIAAGVAVDRGDRVAGNARLGELLLGETAFADRRAACSSCLTAFFNAQPLGPLSEAPAVAFAAGAGAAAEVLLQLLDPARPPLAMAFVPEPRRASIPREGCPCRR